MILKDVLPLDEILHKVEDKKALDFLLQHDIEIFRSTLTDRQVVVLDMILDGYKQYEIAKALDCSPAGITKHKKLIRKKIQKWLIIIK